MNAQSPDSRQQVHHDEHYEEFLKKMVEHRLEGVERRLDYLEQILKIQKRDE